MAHRRIPGIITVLLFTLYGQAQVPLDSKVVEETSYKLYQEKKWDELITFGKRALDENIDYFYIRLRIGIAYYEEGRYRQARTHLQSALEFNSGDPVAQEYYYYCLLHLSQFDDARKFISTLDESQKSRLEGGNKNGLKMFYVEIGPKISSRSDLYANAFYFQAGVNHTLGSKLSVSHVYTYYGQNLKDGPFKQNQYYITANIPLAKGWSLLPAFHLIGQKLDSSIFLPGGSGRPPMMSSISLGSTSVVGSLAIAKNFSFADLSYASGISNVEGFNQFIQQFTFSLFPLGNNRLVVGNIAYYHWEPKNGGTFAFNPYVSVVAMRRLKLVGNYFTNQKMNLVERNGYFVNNSPDLTATRWTGLVDLSLNRHFSMYGLYMLENKLMNTGVEFSYTSYIFGLKYIF